MATPVQSSYNNAASLYAQVSSSLSASGVNISGLSPQAQGFLFQSLAQNGSVSGSEISGIDAILATQNNAPGAVGSALNSAATGGAMGSWFKAAFANLGGPTAPTSSTAPVVSTAPTGSTLPAGSSAPVHSTVRVVSTSPTGSTLPAGSTAPVVSTAPAGSTVPAGSTGKVDSSYWSGFSTAPDTTQVDQNQTGQQIMTALEKDFGLTKTQAAGVAGNFVQESNLSSGMKQGGGFGEPGSSGADVVNCTGFGLAQWGETRLYGGDGDLGLIPFAKANGLDPASPAANYGYMKWELQHKYANTITDIKASTTADQSALAFDTDYEKASQPDMTNRDKYAEEFASGQTVW